VGRKKGPALYELITSKQVSPPPSETTPDVVQEHSHDDVDLEHNVLVPGRSIRVSIGSIGVFVAVGIALIIISYTMGFRKGSAITSKDYEVEDFQTISKSFTDLEDSPALGQILPQQPKNPYKVTGPERWGPLVSDPREANVIYYTLMQTTKEGSVQLATFCRQKGLETYVVSGNNTRPSRVVAFPGSTEPNSSSLKSVQSKIHTIGREWAETKEGRGKDLSDAYLSITKQ